MGVTEGRIGPRPTWKRLCNSWWQRYGSSQEYAVARESSLERLAGQLRSYLQNRISGNGPLPLVDMDGFVESLPKVLGACNCEIYDLPGAADAYAFIHLIDRYRRTWEVLSKLLERGALPFHSREVRVLDVGAGPCASSWAVQDFYRVVQAIASTDEDLRWLSEPMLVVHTVERSKAMQMFGHWFSELSGRPGPFSAEFQDFSGISPAAERRLIRAHSVRELVNGWDYSYREAQFQVNVLEPSWMHHGRYHLILFSNFLTQEKSTANWRTEIAALFRELYAGGVACVIGGTGKPYPAIYSCIDASAKAAQLNRIEDYPERLENNYSDASAQFIKDLFNYIIELLPRNKRERVATLLPNAKDIWDPQAQLTGPMHFGVRVYRTPNRRDVRIKRQHVSSSLDSK